MTSSKGWNSILDQNIIPQISDTFQHSDIFSNFRQEDLAASSGIISVKFDVLEKKMMVRVIILIVGGGLMVIDYSSISIHEISLTNHSI